MGTNSSPSIQLNLQKSLMELQKIQEASQRLARIEGFKWSKVSSNIFEEEQFEHLVKLEKKRSTNYYIAKDEKCGLCRRHLSETPTEGIPFHNDITAVLSCSHVFHADCLAKATPKTENGDPVCPACLKTSDDFIPFSDGLSDQYVAYSNGSEDDSSDQMEDTVSKQLSLPVQEHIGSSSMSASLNDNVKKYLAIKGKKIVKNSLGKKMSGRIGASLSRPPRSRKN